MPELDAKDHKIIGAIADNALLSYADIGKRTKISKDSVKARVKNMMEKKYILSFFPNVDYSKLGYYHFHVYLKFGSIVPEEDKFVAFVKNYPSVIALTKVIGEYDYEIQMLFKNNFELYALLDPIIQMARTAITKVHPMLILRDLEYTMQIEKSGKRSQPPRKQKIKEYQPDEKDLELLKLLSFNAREKFIDLAAQLKTTPEVIRYRMKKLREAGIIAKFHARTNKHRMGLNTYILLLNIKGSPNKQDEQFFKSTPNIYFARAALGDWNLIVSFYCGGNADLVAAMAVIQRHFSQRLNNASLLILFERYNFVPVPRGVSLSQD